MPDKDENFSIVNILKTSLQVQMEASQNSQSSKWDAGAP